MKRKAKFPHIYLAIITLITYIPIILTVVYSFNESKLSSIWGGFSLTWYEALFRDGDMGEALKNSIVLAVLSCLSAIVIGTTGAIGMQKRKNKVNDVVANISLMPLMIPEIILGMVFLAAFSFMNLPFGMLTLVIAHTTFCMDNASLLFCFWKCSSNRIFYTGKSVRADNQYILHSAVLKAV